MKTIDMNWRGYSFSANDDKDRSTHDKILIRVDKYTYAEFTRDAILELIRELAEYIEDDDAAENDILQTQRTKLELGATAAEFVVGPIAEELALCMRYFEKNIPTEETEFPPIKNFFLHPLIEDIENDIMAHAIEYPDHGFKIKVEWIPSAKKKTK